MYNMAIRNRLCPDARQEATLLEHCAHARFVWNLAVEQQSWWRPGRGRAPGSADRQRQLAEARKAEPWLAAGASSVQQQALRDFDRALGAFFDKSRVAGMPSYRSKRGRQGFVIRDTKARRLNRRWGAVFVPKCGYVRFRWTRQLPTELRMARVTCDKTGRWHVSFPAPQPAIRRESTKGSVGLDRGIRTALVTSDGQHYRAPRISAAQAQHYIALQQRMARQHKRSAKRERTRRTLAVMAARVADRRRDWAEKISTRIVSDHDLVVLEKLNIKGMIRRPAAKPDPDLAGNFLRNQARARASLSRGILASCWGVLAERLEHKAVASGVTVVQIDPRFTSQQCHVCGHTAKENRESQAVFRCQECGHEDHADRNAARNILARGLLLTTGELVPAHAPGHGVSRPQKSPALAGAAGITRSAA
jgi:transposase